MKKYLIIILAVFAVGTVKAQSGYGYKPWGVGFGLSYATAYTNVSTTVGHPAIDASLVYSLIPYFPIALEFQAGQFSGGGASQNLDIFGRYYTNNYKAILIHEDLHMGAYLDYSSDPFLRVIKNIYGGTGVGLVFNSLSKINRYGSNGYIFPGSNNSKNLVIPIRVGYEFKIYSFDNAPNISVDLGYTHNLVFNGGLDGYNDPSSIFKHNSLEQYTQFTAGIKVFFGETKLYNKLIRSYRRY